MSQPASLSSRVTLRPLPGSPQVGFPLDVPAPLRAGSQLTLAQWLLYWLSYLVEPHRARTTVYCYSNIVKNHLIPALGEVRLSELTPSMIDGYYQWLSSEKKLSPNTIYKHHILLHTSLRQAYRQGAILDNPVRRATPPGTVPGCSHYYTPKQVAQLLALVEGHPLELPVRLACYLGLRRGEILGLRWRDVDLQSGLIFVRQVRTTIGHRIVVKQPKTAGSTRTLSIRSLNSLLPMLREMLRTRTQRSHFCGPDDYIVLDSRDQPWHPNSLTTTFTRFAAACGLPPITLHGLRHTFASMASNARVPMYQISRAMGHSSPTTTQRIYTHLFDLTHGEVLAAVSAAIPAAKASKRMLDKVKRRRRHFPGRPG